MSLGISGLATTTFGKNPGTGVKNMVTKRLANGASLGNHLRCRRALESCRSPNAGVNGIPGNKLFQRDNLQRGTRDGIESAAGSIKITFANGSKGNRAGISHSIPKWTTATL